MISFPGFHVVLEPIASRSGAATSRARRDKFRGGAILKHHGRDRENDRIFHDPRAGAVGPVRHLGQEKVAG